MDALGFFFSLFVDFFWSERVVNGLFVVCLDLEMWSIACNLCVWAYGRQRWDVRTDVNETKQISPLVFFMFLLYVLLMRRILTINY